ncbi:MAG: glycosyltransferase family 2 protein [Thermodesulfobacteriota bacterium]|nr:glycosyltransferase family 2 protein [Thermodesulfobacteriota bacterium]
MMAIISVIIPTFNRADKVVRAISSVLDQTFVDFEIIVVDDGSIDGTKGAVARFDDRITYIEHSLNLGVSAARNTGIRKSTGEFIAFLDSDDSWLPEKLQVQMGFFDSHPRAVALQTEEIWIRNGRRVNPRIKHLKPSGDIFEPSIKLCLISPSAVMIKRSLLKEVGLFDENLPACEDYDLWLRISCRYPVYLVQEQLVIKEGGTRDQLSLQHKGMDRFRIKSLVKLLKGGLLNQRQTQAAFEGLSLKCRIYGNGCIKRGKSQEGRYFLGLPEKLKYELSDK